MIEQEEFRLNLTRAIAEDDFPLCDEDGKLTNAGIDRLVETACAAAEELFDASANPSERKK